MAKTTHWGFSNVTPQATGITPIALGLVSNYAVTKNDATNCIMANKTAPIDAEEYITLRSRDIDQVKTLVNLQNPSKVKGGVQYQSEFNAVLVTEDSDDPSFRVDEPVVAQLTVRHPKSGNITEQHIIDAIMRTISAFRKDDGTWRITDLMRGSERPATD